MGAATPVAILTGFLGSGKTTLLKHVLSHPDMKGTAVIINEFGEVSIDHLLVARATENIIEMRNGCLCCTIREDLAMTLRELHQKRVLGEVAPFEYVIIETTGLADPVPILHTLMANPPLRKAFVPDVVVTCIDVLNCLPTLSDHECARSQCAIADLVLLTKTDLVGEDLLAEVRERVAELNPGAEITEVVEGRIDYEKLFGRRLFEPGNSSDHIREWLERQAQPHLDHHHATEYRTLVLSAPGPISMAGMAVFFNRLVNEYRDEVLRVKGIFSARERGGCPAVVHGIREKFYPIQWLDAWPSDDHSSRFVLIGKTLDEQHLSSMFADLCTQ